VSTSFFIWQRGWVEGHSVQGIGVRLPVRDRAALMRLTRIHDALLIGVLPANCKNSVSANFCPEGFCGQEPPMQVFVISLKGSQSESNRKLASMLENERFTVSVIDAVYGPELNAKDYFSAIQHYLSFRNRLITPSELGCALSRKKAYEALLRTGESHGLILEDDVILDADACANIRQIMEKMGQFDGYLHLGGMDGLLRSFERVGGTICCEIPPVFGFTTAISAIFIAPSAM
jgi:hypothetical protein